MVSEATGVATCHPGQGSPPALPCGLLFEARASITAYHSSDRLVVPPPRYPIVRAGTCSGVSHLGPSFDYIDHASSRPTFRELRARLTISSAHMEPNEDLQAATRSSADAKAQDDVLGAVLTAVVASSCRLLFCYLAACSATLERRKQVRSRPSFLFVSEANFAS